MEKIVVDGCSVKLTDRKSVKKRGNCDNLLDKFNLDRKLYTPTNQNNCPIFFGAKMRKSSSCRSLRVIEIREDGKDPEKPPKKRRILKRPKVFDTYYSGRKVLPLASYSLPRCYKVNENLTTRGRQTLCKFLDNEVLNEQLKQIKLAESTEDLHRLIAIQLRDQARNTPVTPQRESLHLDLNFDYRSVIDFPENLAKVNKPCPCFPQKPKLFKRTSKTPNKELNLKSPNFQKSIETNQSLLKYIQVASHYYKYYIQYHFNYLDHCNQTVKKLREERNLVSKPGARQSLVVKSFIDSITVQLNKLYISSGDNTDSTILPTNSKIPDIPGQSTTAFTQTMNESDLKGIQAKSPENPQIILSDHSSDESDQDKEFQDISSDNSLKNSLTIPRTKSYCSEARPP